MSAPLETRPPRARTRGRAVTRRLVPALLLSACFTGEFAVGLPCAADSDCGPKLRCEDGLCGGPGGAPVCGNGLVETDEQCDDGNEDPADGCTDECRTPRCGDGILHAGEVCDDGDDDDTDSCVAGCKPSTCGDGFVEAGVEQCDDGNDDDTDACVACKSATCGDGSVRAGAEACDDGNPDDTDACVACEPARCGDGFVRMGAEECDDGDTIEDARCTAGCMSKGMIGQWTFEPGVEEDDLTGHFATFAILGDAEIVGGELHVHATPEAATGWALAGEYKGPDIREKTLVAWVALVDLDIRSGAPLSLDGVGNGYFDAIVYGEKTPFRWMAGSNGFERTEEVDVDESVEGEVLQMAIAYHEIADNGVEITICRNGVQLLRYEKPGVMQTWFPGTSEARFGTRVGDQLGGDGSLEARIAEARIYGRAMSCAEVAMLTM